MSVSAQAIPCSSRSYKNDRCTSCALGRGICSLVASKGGRGMFAVSCGGFSIPLSWSRVVCLGTYCTLVDPLGHCAATGLRCSSYNCSLPQVALYHITSAEGGGKLAEDWFWHTLRLNYQEALLGG